MTQPGVSLPTLTSFAPVAATAVAVSGCGSSLLTLHNEGFGTIRVPLDGGRGRCPRGDHLPTIVGALRRHWCRLRGVRTALLRCVDVQEG